MLFEGIGSPDVVARSSRSVVVGSCVASPTRFVRNDKARSPAGDTIPIDFAER